ncbi:Gallate dioxygenase [Marinomonas aquimarina]|uniref:Gallate dioxygenase n=1 Tax=Marinomonas aquimarina TaxID=295068 RepID=A0A1A8TJZ6_9GAMM|nr:gallate dioxygenase [Marinomonas aquimarina]SBS33216.1 Gallate dioxygenase [Marinomonas aquimarina]
MMMLAEEGEWHGSVVPLQVGVLQFPAPSAKRCYDFGKALRQAILSYPEDLNVAIIATGGLSHQVHGERCGFNNEPWDEEFLQRLETKPESLTELTHAEYATKGGMEGAEVIMWLIMRGALSDDICCVHKASYCPPMTNIATLILEEQGANDSSELNPMAQIQGIEQLEGTYPFTVETSHRAYRLNDFLRRLIEPQHRERFIHDQAALMQEFDLTAEEQTMVSGLKWIELIRYGVIFFCLEKMAAVLGRSNPEVYAAMRGETMEEFQASRKVAMQYSVSAKTS